MTQKKKKKNRNNIWTVGRQQKSVCSNLRGRPKLKSSANNFFCSDDYFAKMVIKCSTPRKDEDMASHTNILKDIFSPKPFISL
jgi:hypothetical protein